MINLPVGVSGRTALDIASDAARTAGDLVVGNFHSEKEVTFKGRNDVVTNVDVASETIILDLLRKEYPDFGVLAEESDEILTESSFSWIVDPIDGTRNYASGIPHFCIVVALQCEGEMVLGVTYDPVRKEMFYAESGKGAFLNGDRVYVSNKKRLEQCVIGFDLGYVDDKGAMALDLVRSLWPNMQAIRVTGSSALGLAYAACGRFDIYFHHHLYPWDIASGLVLVKEGGGLVVDKKGNETTVKNSSVIGSSKRLIAEFLELTNGMEWRM